ncbi:MAG TPA: hypothetical protein VNO55_06365 [Polyangia bacterium]|nr:hypothetical protein [Polyangia bacterium]
MFRRSLIAVAIVAALSIVAGYPGVLVAVAQTDVQGVCGSGDGTPNHPFIRSAQPEGARCAARHRREAPRSFVRLDPGRDQPGALVLPPARHHANSQFPSRAVDRTSPASTSPRGPPTR